MKYFGFAPFQPERSRKKYIIPSIISIFHTVCLLCRFVCFTETFTSPVTFILTTSYIETALLQIYFFFIFKMCVNQEKSWRILELEALGSHVNDLSRIFYKMLVVALQIFYIVIMILEYKYGVMYNASCRLSWIYLHESHYLNFMLIYFVLEYLLIFQQSYKKMNTVLIEFVKRTTTESVSKSLCKYQLLKIRRKFSRQHMVLQHFSKTFGWPICLTFTMFFVMYVKNMGFLFFESRRLNFVYQITPTIQLTFFTVS